MSGLIESETRFPGLPQPAPEERSACQRTLDELVPKALTGGWLQSLRSIAQTGTPEQFNTMLEHVVRWVAIDVFYAGKAEERREFGEGYLQGLADLERAIKGVKS